VCWSCLFPIRIAGVPIGGGDVPAGASNAVVCACNDGLGVPRLGFTIGLWEPARIIEAAWLTSPPALAACLADGVSASAGVPLDELSWCAGTWGLIYPFAGAQPTLGSRPRWTSLSATRTLAALHRRGLARRTLGDAALCKAPIEPFLPKSQYKLSMFYPLPEANGSHVIGESPFRWGIHRTYAGPGEDHLYLLRRWQDCCATF
jgi:conjugal transfer pilus assembly protein TraU